MSPLSKINSLSVRFVRAFFRREAQAELGAIPEEPFALRFSNAMDEAMLHSGITDDDCVEAINKLSFVQSYTMFIGAGRTDSTDGLMRPDWKTKAVHVDVIRTAIRESVENRVVQTYLDAGLVSEANAAPFLTRTRKQEKFVEAVQRMTADRFMEQSRKNAPSTNKDGIPIQ